MSSSLGESPIQAFGDGKVEEAPQQRDMVSCQIGAESRGFGSMQRTYSLGQMKQNTATKEL